MRAQDNPFSVTCQHALKYRFAEGDSLDKFMSRLEANNWRGALIGEKGNGKTTFMLELAEHLADKGFGVKKLFLNREKRKFNRRKFRDFLRNLNENDIILFDGSEQMVFWRWWKFLFQTRKARGLVITAHQPSKLPTVLHADTSFEFFYQMVQEMIENHQVLQDVCCEERLREMFECHKGNVRMALRELYDVAADL